MFLQTDVHKGIMIAGTIRKFILISFRYIIWDNVTLCCWSISNILEGALFSHMSATDTKKAHGKLDTIIAH